MKYRKIIMMIFLVLIAMISVGCETEDSVPTEGLIYEQLEWKYEYAVTGYEGDSETVVVPETYNGMPVTTIKTGALMNASITSLELPDTITYLENDSVYVGNMESFRIPKNLYYFAQAFGDNRGSVDIIVPSNHAFFKEVEICNREAVVTKDKTALVFIDGIEDTETIFNLPDSYTEIMAYAFCGTHFKEINIPDSVTSIGIGAFRKVTCDKITISASITAIADETFIYADCPSIVLPNTVEEIGENAFSSSSLSSFTFPTSLKSIGELAFFHTNLAGELVLPEGLEVIGDGAFCNCLLTSIVLPSTLTDISYGFFGNNVNLINLNNVTNVTFNNISFTDMDLVDYFVQFIGSNYLYAGYSRSSDPNYVVEITITLPHDPTEADILEDDFREAWNEWLNLDGGSTYTSFTEDSFVYEYIFD